jgi:uncharacterized protein YggE
MPDVLRPRFVALPRRDRRTFPTLVRWLPPGGQDGAVAETGIQVVGRGDVRGAPDTVTLAVGVSVTRPSVAEAAREAGTRSRALTTR